MTNAILRGKPDAGNPHVRFDEGEVASYPPTAGRPEGVAMRGAKPRRGFLLYKLIRRGVLAVAFVLQSMVGLSGDVDPFIGTGGVGHLYPGPKWPNGMVSPGPDTGTRSWNYCGGYQFGDRAIYGFSQVHLSGTGAGELMDVLVQPFTGDCPADDYRGYHDKSTETAEPGYYACVYTNFGVKAELTASRRVAYHRYTFDGRRPAHVLVDLDWGMIGWLGPEQPGGRIVESESRVEDGVRVVGRNVTKVWVDGKEICYAVEFSRRPTAWRELPAAGRKAKRYVFDFDLKPGESVGVKAALSSVDPEGALANLRADPPGFDFDRRRAECAAAWRERLSRAVPEGEARACRIFSTALYHAFLEPSLFSDVDGRYRGADAKVHRAEGYEQYTMFAQWDVFRAEDPLYTLLAPELVPHFVRSMLSEYDQIGRVTKFQVWGREVLCMVGDHSVPFIVDAILKGLAPGVDPAKAFAAIDATLTSTRKGEYAACDYDALGYYPIGSNGSPCSHSLEHGLDDACAAMLAQHLGLTERQEFYVRRAKYYRRLFDPVSGMFRARHADGRWREPFDPLKYGAGGGDPNFDYTESCALNYAWHVLHDPKGLIGLHGGARRFAADLDRLFRKDEGWATRSRDGDCTGLIGEYAQGNEPQNHVPYYYQFVGRGDRTAEIVREIFDRFYSDSPSGICGNDDCGQLSAWCVFSAMGFYPFMPCGGQYVLGAPQLPKVTLKLGGKSLTVLAQGISKESKFVRRVTRDGRSYENFRLSHSDLLKGGRLVFEMTDQRPSRPDRLAPAAALRANLLEIGRSKEFVYGWSTAEGDWHVKGSTGFHTKIGDDPLVMFCEFGRIVGTWYGKDFYEINRKALADLIRREFREHRTIPFVTWHMENPYVPAKCTAARPTWYHKGCEGYPQEHADVVGEILSGTGAVCGTGACNGDSGRSFRNPREWYDWMLKECAAFCRELKDDDGRRIPVAFRLFHECDGAWFWWGSGHTTPERLIRLHRLSVDYLRRELGKDNVLFCYSPDRTWDEAGEPGKSGFLTRYPGDKYMDILGFDDYGFGHGQGEAKRANYEATLRRLRIVSKEGRRRGKSCAIFESSAEGTTDFYSQMYRIVREPGVDVALMTTYDGPWTFPASAEGLADMKDVLSREDVLTAKSRRDLSDRE